MGNVALTLTNEEADLLYDILHVWREGNLVAKQETAQDRSIEDAEELVNLVAGLDDQNALVDHMLEQLDHQREEVL